MPLRLQAYERLMILSERIQIPSLLTRLDAPGMNSGQLYASLLLGLKQEFEHNASQQIYVSDELWQIITLSRDQIVKIIESTVIGIDPKSSSSVYHQALMQFMQKHDLKALNTASEAIKKEVALLF